MGYSQLLPPLLFKLTFLKLWVVTTCRSYNQFTGLLPHILEIKRVRDWTRLHQMASHVIKVPYFTKFLLVFFSTNIY